MGQIGQELKQRGVRVSAFPQHPGLAAPLRRDRRAPARPPERPALERPRGERDRQTRPPRVEDRQGQPGRQDRRRGRALHGDRQGREPAGADEARRVALARPCLGCGRLIAVGSRCPACRLRRPRGRRWQATKRQVFARYGRSCVYCGAPATDVDHLIPIADDGGDELSNLRPACARCNRGRR